VSEIKSTLDIIMEKAKGITVSEEEKRAFQKRELEGRVRGYLQKCLDGVMDPERLKREIEELAQSQGIMAKKILRDECAARLDPNADNEPLFEILRHAADLDPAPLAKVVSAFRNELAERRTLREKVLLDALRQKGVSGSAVSANTTADPEWRRILSERKEAMHRELSSLSGDASL
jgi:hypothetical protein